jgi:hypothetical protein
VLARERGDRARHDRGVGALERGDAQPPAREAGDGLDLGPGRRHAIEDRLGVAQQDPARLGEADAARRALEQPRAAAIWRDTAGCVNDSASAAPESDPRRTTSRKTRRREASNTGAGGSGSAMTEVYGFQFERSFVVMAPAVLDPGHDVLPFPPPPRIRPRARSPGPAAHARRPARRPPDPPAGRTVLIAARRCGQRRRQRIAPRSSVRPRSSTNA